MSHHEEWDKVSLQQDFLKLSRCMERFFKLKHFVTRNVFKNIYEINYDKLYEQKIRLILFDLDNTLIPYHVKVLSDKEKNFLTSLKEKGFTVGIVSNNRRKRVLKALNGFDGLILSMSYKPLIFKVKRKIKKLPFNLNEVVLVGDQLMTDVLCANRLGIASVLVKPIDRSTEKKSTIRNRKREIRIIRRLQKTNPEFVRIYKNECGN